MRAVWPLVALLALLLTACADSKADERSSATAADYIDVAMIPKLQETATAACLCQRSTEGNARSSCWREFDVTVARYHHASEASACGVESSSHVIFAEQVPDGGDPFENSRLLVMTEFPYGACSAEEVSIKAAEYEGEGGSPPADHFCAQATG